MSRQPTRRRFLTIMGVAASSALLGSAPGHTRWHGTALGADAEMIFAGSTPARAENAIASCLAELERLEQIFSLYRRESELTRLNRGGRLNNPSRDLVILLQYAKWFSDQTFGAFDCTVQPVWRELAHQFSTPAQEQQPDRGKLNEVLRHVGHQHIHVSDSVVTLSPGTLVTLNGIAQGYITDRIADILEASGWRDALINMGELRALPGEAWPVRARHGAIRLSLSGDAAATSAGTGTPLSSDGRWHHLIDPRTATSRNHVAAVTVKAPHALTADALSTALACAAPEELAAIAARFPGARIVLQRPDGSQQKL